MQRGHAGGKSWPFGTTKTCGFDSPKLFIRMHTRMNFLICVACGRSRYSNTKRRGHCEVVENVSHKIRLRYTHEDVYRFVTCVRHQKAYM